MGDTCSKTLFGLCLPRPSFSRDTHGDCIPKANSDVKDDICAQTLLGPIIFDLANEKISLPLCAVLPLLILCNAFFCEKKALKLIINEFC